MLRRLADLTHTRPPLLRRCHCHEVEQARRSTRNERRACCSRLERSLPASGRDSAAGAASSASSSISTTSYKEAAGCALDAHSRRNRRLSHRVRRTMLAGLQKPAPSRATRSVCAYTNAANLADVLTLARGAGAACAARPAAGTAAGTTAAARGRESLQERVHPAAGSGPANGRGSAIEPGRIQGGDDL